MRDSIPILGPSSQNSVIQVNPQRGVNLFLKREGAGAKSPFSLRQCPGLVLMDEASAGVGRSNGVEWQNRTWFVVGEKFCGIDSNGAVTEVGTLLTADSRCEIAAGRDYIMITDGTYGYAYDGATFTQDIQNTDSDFPDNPTHCRYIDTFFMANESGTGNFYKSATENPLSWDGLEFEVASAAPDDVLAIEVYDRDFIALGQYTTQRYTNTGDADFPFSPYPNTVQAGILAPYSLATSVYGTIFLANTKDGSATVVLLNGGSQTVISDSDIHDRIGRSEGLSGAFASIYTQNGHTFYCLTIPSEDLTLCCDLSEGYAWHDRSSLIDGEAGRWRINGIGYLSGNKVYAVDAYNTNMYELSLSTYTENGEEMQGDRYGQLIHNNGNRLTVHSIEFDMEKGKGVTGDITADPTIMMRVSKDGGMTYSPFRSRTFGQQGQYQKRTTFRRVGDYVQFNFHIRITDAVPRAIFGAFADIEWGK